MQTILKQLENRVRQAIRAAFDLDADPIVQLSQNQQFGDYQSNAAMGLAKVVAEKTGQKANPRQIAERILQHIDLADFLAEKPSIAGPGFINFKLAPSFVARSLSAMLSVERMGIERVESPQTVVVDYSGVNIAKEMAVWHLRSTIIGDCFARVLEFQGHHVIRQNHLGDWGTQFGRVVLGMWYRVCFEHYGKLDVLQELIRHARGAGSDTVETAVRKLASFHNEFLAQDADSSFFAARLNDLTIDLEELQELYQFTSTVTEHAKANEEMIRRGDDERPLADIPRLITTYVQNPDKQSNKPEELAWKKSREITMQSCREVYRRLGVGLAEQHERGESFYQSMLPQIVRELLEKGIAAESEGAIVVFIDGPDKSPLIIRKSDGGYLYGTTDLAGVKYRAQTLNAKRIIYTHDSRQAQHFSQVFRTAQKAGWADGVSLEYAPFGTMLGEDGRPFRTRGGEMVKLRDVLDEAEERALAVVEQKNPSLPNKHAIAHAVGIGAVKYADLSKDRTSDYIFSWDKMLSMEGNTAPYLQYAHARVRALFRKAGVPAGDFAIAQLDSPFEQGLAKQILRLPDVIDAVARELRPHLLCTFLYDLASRFSAFYENCDVLKSDEPVRSTRLALCEATARSLELGLDMLGIEHPDEL
jgi:arginyl-tRNA synthetase